MSEQNDRRSVGAAYAILFGVGVLFPLGAVLFSYWFLRVSLPTLMFISFALLFLGGFLCYPVRSAQEPPVTAPSGDTRSEAVILLIVGQASGLGVLILFFVRLVSQGIHFSWM